jgi:dihydropteroate synthase
MDAACAAGAQVINDVNALRADQALAVAARHQAGVCLVHMQGEPRTMQDAPHYGDVVAEVKAYLAQRAEACIRAGLARERIVIDPGFGFGKRLEHNLALLRGLPALAALGLPLLVGLSRKSMFKQLLNRAADERVAGSAAAAAIAVWQGAVIVRAHDVRATMDAVRFAAAARAAPGT